MEVEKTEFYRTRNGAVIGPMRPVPEATDKFYVSGVKLAWGIDGRLLSSVVKDHPLDLIDNVMIVDLPADRDLPHPGMSDDFGHLLEAVDQLTPEGHGSTDLDNDMVVFTMRGFEQFAQKTFLIGEGIKRVESGLNKMAYEQRMKLTAEIKVPTGVIRVDSYVPPNAKTFAEFSDELIHKIAKSYGLPYSLVAGDLSRLRGMSFTEAMQRAAESAKRLSERLTAITPAPGPGISRKGWPLIGSVWMHRNGNEYEVVEHTNVEGGKPDYPPTVVYRNTENGKLYSRRLNLWQPASFTFKRDPIQMNAVPLDSTGPIPKRVFWDSRGGKFFRLSAHRGKVYPLPPQFKEAWGHRTHEFPVGGKVGGPATIVTPKVRLTFPHLFRETTPNLGEPYYPGEKIEANFSFHAGGEKIDMKLDSLYRVKPEAALPLDIWYDLGTKQFYKRLGEFKFDKMPPEFTSRWAYRANEFPNMLYVSDMKGVSKRDLARSIGLERERMERIRLKALQDAKKAEHEAIRNSMRGSIVLGKSEREAWALCGGRVKADAQPDSIAGILASDVGGVKAGTAMKLNPDGSVSPATTAPLPKDFFEVTGKPPHSLAPGLRRFLEEIGEVNGYGKFVGLIQHKPNELVAQFDNPSGRVEVPVRLPTMTRFKTE